MSSLSSRPKGDDLLRSTVSVAVATMALVLVVFSDSATAGNQICTLKQRMQAYMRVSVKIACCDPQEASWNAGHFCCYDATYGCLCTPNTICTKRKRKPTDTPVMTPHPTIHPAIIKPTIKIPIKPTIKTPTQDARKVCSSFRLLNGEKADPCIYPGVARIFANVGKTDDKVTLCNGAYVSAMIGGKAKMAFYTTNTCKKIIDNKGKLDIKFALGDEGVAVPTVDTLFDKVDEPNSGSTFFVIKPAFQSIVMYKDKCRQPACTFTPAMVNDVDLNKCELVSFGPTKEKTFDYEGLQKTDVMFTSNALCSGISGSDMEKNTMCYRSMAMNNITCGVADSGSLLFCNSKAKEKVLVGMSAYNKECNSSPYVRIVPYPHQNPSRSLKSTPTPATV